MFLKKLPLTFDTFKIIIMYQTWQFWHLSHSLLLSIAIIHILPDAFKNVPNPCTNNPDNKVYFPHPTDMTKFIQCDRYGRMYIIQCPDNLEYSKTTSTCRQVAVATQAPAVVTVPAGVVTQAPVVVVDPNNPCTAAELSAGNIYFAVKGG